MLTAKEVVAAHAARLMQLPNVVGIGVGSRGSRPVIKILVTRKVTPDQVTEAVSLPESIEGFPVEVEEVGEVTIQGQEGGTDGV